MPHLIAAATILAAHDMVTERVETPEWELDGYVLVASLTGADRDDFEAEMFEGKGPDRRANYRNLRARLLAPTLVDENGARLFADADIVALGQKNAAVLDRLFGVAQHVNGLGERDVEELVKNSASGPVDASPSNSPASSAA